MPDSEQTVVTNTTPLIALTAATGSLDALRFLYTRVVVPFEVAQEIRAGGHDAFWVDVFKSASWLEIGDAPVVLAPYLQNALDLGEASVIQTALDLIEPGSDQVCVGAFIGR
jgi:predicted nucleic acid-binding protein